MNIDGYWFAGIDKLENYSLSFFYSVKAVKLVTYIFCQIHINKGVGGIFYVHVDKGYVVHQMSTKVYDR